MFSVNMHRVEHKVMCVHFTEQVKKTNTSARTVLFVPSEMEAELPVRGLKQSSGLSEGMCGSQKNLWKTARSFR